DNPGAVQTGHRPHPQKRWCVAALVGETGATVTKPGLSPVQRSDHMTYFVGLDVSLQETAVCIVDQSGTIVSEWKVPTEPDDIITLLTSIGGDYERIGVEAGPLSQWLVPRLSDAGFPVICVETRH